MKFATFIAELKEDYSAQIPREVCERLKLQPGDRIEISVKRIKSRKIDIFLAENPLYRLISDGLEEK
ncbi:MAG: hypothetical protein ACRBF0_10650 [Calditrichia bacterium]